MLSSAPIPRRSHPLQPQSLSAQTESIDQPDPGSTGSKRWVGWALAALLILSFALRAWDASQELQAGRYYDERYTFRNVSLILRQGNWRPAQAYYLSLSYLPQTAVLATSEALHRATGFQVLSIYGRSSDRYSPTAYLLARLCNVTYGVLSLWMLFLIGRRIFSPEVGLLAAAILAAFPRHLLSSTQFKPDILVLLLALVTFYWTLEAALHPGLRRFLKVGLGVGLSVATKYTGVGAAIPIVAFVLARGWRDRRLWAWAALAGLTSIVIFVVLNPFLGVVLEFIPKLLGHYSGNARQRGSDHEDVLVQQGQFLLEHHGPWVAAFAAAGLIALVWRILRPDDGREPWTPERRLGASLALAHFLGYSAFHAGAMTLFRGQNYLLVVPFSSLFAAWSFVGLWRFLVERASRPGMLPAMTPAVCLIPIAILLYEQADLVYERVIPSTWDKAAGVLAAELAPVELRQVVYETQGGATLRVIHGGNRAVTTGAPELARIDPARLDQADAEVFLRSRFQGELADFYRHREALLGGGRAQVVSGAPFHTRGEPVVLLLHPWSSAAPPEPLSLGRPAPARALAARLPKSLHPHEVVSLVLWIPRDAGALDWVRVEPGGRRLSLTETGRRGRRLRLVTPRFELSGEEARVRIPAPPEMPVRNYRLELHRWKR